MGRIFFVSSDCLKAINLNKSSFKTKQKKTSTKCNLLNYCVLPLKESSCGANFSSLLMIFDGFLVKQSDNTCIFVA